MDATLQNLMIEVEKATDELVDLHRQLVRIPTINTGAPDSGNETEVCQLLDPLLDGAILSPKLVLRMAQVC